MVETGKYEGSDKKVHGYRQETSSGNKKQIPTVRDMNVGGATVQISDESGWRHMSSIMSQSKNKKGASSIRRGRCICTLNSRGKKE
jgi:hypothetical protein